MFLICSAIVLFSGCAEIGGVLGNCSEAQRVALREYGFNLGIAFQIVDDVLDYTSDEKVLGKPIGGDLREGKVTLPVILWLQGRPSREKGEARALVEAAGRDDDARGRLVRHLAADGALAAADAAARDEATAAEAALAPLSASPDRELLRTIADYVVRRAL